MTKRQCSPIQNPPDYINEFAWASWLSYRRIDKRKPVSERAAKLQWEALQGLSMDQQMACINRSIMSSWTGLFPEQFAVIQPRTRTTIEHDLTDRSWAS